MLHTCTCTNTDSLRKCAPNGTSMLQRFEHGNMIEIRNGIMFDFYLGLPHTSFIHL